MTESDRAGREGFLARWSERKRAVRESEAAEEAAVQPEGEAAPEEGLDEEALAANRAAAEAIDLDSLTVGSDMSSFLKAGVPAALKQAAYRKLWRSDPVFALQDGLDIYRENFHDPSYLLTGGSSWEPGSGYAKRFAELKEQAKEALARAEAEAAEAAETADAAPGEAAEEAPAAEPAETAEAAVEERETAEEAAGEETEAAEPEPAPRVPLRARLDLTAFEEEG